jgi:hypothetical protein
MIPDWIQFSRTSTNCSERPALPHPIISQEFKVEGLQIFDTSGDPKLERELQTRWMLVPEASGSTDINHILRNDKGMAENHQYRSSQPA